MPLLAQAWRVANSMVVVAANLHTTVASKQDGRVQTAAAALCTYSAVIVFAVCSTSASE